MFLPPATAHASPSDPSQWPAFPGADPELTATSHTIRFSGPDRYQTNLALGLALRGKGDFPFDTSDPTSGGASGFAEADDWWGASTCPRSIILVAGDTFADALAAASLSDPTDRSEQPRLQRVAAQDPLFDPIGGFDRPDTAYAPVVVTTSARSGASQLAPTARVTANDLNHGGCTTAHEAIIVGGSDAVPAGVESQLIAIGYREVFRVAGSNRYETAANVATAMGTAEPTSDACIDPSSDDGSTTLGWYGNGAFEYRSDAKTCRVLPRAVVLADGGTGADALAAGWWTSYWQVPILLTGPDGSLPTATRLALQTLPVDTVVVLGGTARIPESTVDQARFLAGAVAGRIAGSDRTATSIEMAKAFGGWHPTDDGSDFAGDLACFAASTGVGLQAVGWPDALAAGPMCARLGAARGGSPARALPPAAGAAAATATTGDQTPAHDAVPVILLAPGDTLPESVVDFLGASFSPDADWCSGDHADAECLAPGFGVILGGESAIPPTAGTVVNYLLSGSRALDRGDLSPKLTDVFPTSLDLRPVYSRVGDVPGPSLCVPAGSMRDLRWISFTRDVDRRAFLADADVLRAGVYDQPTGSSKASCVAVIGSSDPVVSAGVSLSGHLTEPRLWNLGADRHLSVSGLIRQEGSRTVTPEGTTSWSVFGAPADSVTITRRGQSAELRTASLDLDVTIAADGRQATVTGSFSVTTSLGSSQARVTAVALRSDGSWELAGSAQTGPFAEGDTLGGFRGTIVDPGDGSITANWTFDGF